MPCILVSFILDDKYIILLTNSQFDQTLTQNTFIWLKFYIFSCFITIFSTECTEVFYLYSGGKIHGGSGQFRPRNAEKSPRK